MDRPFQIQPGDDQQRWPAMVRRDRSADGFVYAVRTTGVYCRPGCPSRRPKRENTVYFDDWRTAEREGYRPCRKCRPRGERGPEPVALLEACRLMGETEETMSTARLAERVGVSPSHLHRQFKRVLGVTPKAYSQELRQQRLRGKLSASRSVTRALYEAGFASASRCYEKAGQTLGMTPRDFQRKAAGARIRYAIEKSELGWVLVAATQRGVCMIELDDRREALEDRLAERFARAASMRRDTKLKTWVARVLAFIKRPAMSLALPLDIQGTAFQRRVWEALQMIPPGATRTYRQVAEAIGDARAARAVAGACAANPAALAIPCHRVIRGDGGLSGYRWGVQRKRALLERESRSRLRG